MFKKIAIKTGVLTTVFILAVIVSSYVTNRGNTDMSADMGGATLPRISFMTEGYEVNSLPGYKSDMTLTSMRDTLTPVTNNQLDMNIAKYDNQIQKVYWQVYTLNGKKCIQEGTIKDVQDTVTLNFKNMKILKEERILKVTLYLDNQNIYFYTRIKNSADCNYKKAWISQMISTMRHSKIRVIRSKAIWKQIPVRTAPPIRRSHLHRHSHR